MTDSRMRQEKYKVSLEYSVGPESKKAFKKKKDGKFQKDSGAT